MKKMLLSIAFTQISLLSFYKISAQNEPFINVLIMPSEVKKWDSTLLTFNEINYSKSYNDKADTILLLDGVEQSFNRVYNSKTEYHHNSKEIFIYSYDLSGKIIHILRDSFDISGYKVLSDDIWPVDTSGIFSKTMIYSYNDNKMPKSIQRRNFKDHSQEPNIDISYFDNGFVKDLLLNIHIGKMYISGKQAEANKIFYKTKTEYNDDFKNAMKESKMENGEDQYDEYILQITKAGKSLNKSTIIKDKAKKVLKFNCKFDMDNNIVEYISYGTDIKVNTNFTRTYDAKKRVVSFTNKITKKQYFNTFDDKNRPLRIYNDLGFYSEYYYNNSDRLTLLKEFDTQDRLNSFTIYSY